MRISDKPTTTNLGLSLVKRQIIAATQRPGFRSLAIAPCTLHRQGYSFSITTYTGGMETEQLREPLNAARQLFQGKVEKIILKKGVKEEDLAALFQRLTDREISLQDFNRPNIEITFRGKQPTAETPVLKLTPTVITSSQAVAKTIVEPIIAPPIQTAAAVPSPQTPADLLAAGNRLKKQASQNPGNPPTAEIEAWIASAKERLAAYQTELGPGPKHNWTETLIAQRVTFADLVEAMRKLEAKLGQTPTEINLPGYVPEARGKAWYKQPKFEPRRAPTRPRPAAPAVPVEKSEESPARVVAQLFGNHCYIAGVRGELAYFEGKIIGILPSHLALPNDDIVEVFDTGARLEDETRSFRVFCSYQFMTDYAQSLFNAIANGESFHYNYSHLLKVGVEMVSATERIGQYIPQGTISSDEIPALRDSTGTFQLTVKYFSKDWTVSQLVEALAKQPPQAIPVEKERPIFPQAIQGERLNYLEIWESKLHGSKVGFIEDKVVGFLPNQLTTDPYAFSPMVVDTGINSITRGFTYRVYCEQEFLTKIAPRLHKAIINKELFHLGEYSKFGDTYRIVAREAFDNYPLRANLLAEDYLRLAGSADATFSLTVEGFNKEWTVVQLVRAMASNKLRAVPVEQTTAPQAQADKPPRPAKLQTRDQLISVIADIRRINWDCDQGEISELAASVMLAAINTQGLRVWFEYLTMDNNLAKEYDYCNWDSQLRDALQILNDFNARYPRETSA